MIVTKIPVALSDIKKKLTSSNSAKKSFTMLGPYLLMNFEKKSWFSVLCLSHKISICFLSATSKLAKIDWRDSYDYNFSLTTSIQKANFLPNTQLDTWQSLKQKNIFNAPSNLTLLLLLAITQWFSNPYQVKTRSSSNDFTYRYTYFVSKRLISVNF